MRLVLPISPLQTLISRLGRQMQSILPFSNEQSSRVVEPLANVRLCAVQQINGAHMNLVANVALSLRSVPHPVIIYDYVIAEVGVISGGRTHMRKLQKAHSVKSLAVASNG